MAMRHQSQTLVSLPTHLLSTNTHEPTAGTAVQPNQPTRSVVEAEQEKAFRYSRNQVRYKEFLKDSELRRGQRQDIESRNKTWQDGCAKAWKRIDAIEKEKAELLIKINMMDEARKTYNEGNSVDVSEKEDAETKRKWEAYIKLESEELDV